MKHSTICTLTKFAAVGFFSTVFLAIIDHPNLPLWLLVALAPIAVLTVITAFEK